MDKKTVRDVELTGKRVLVRVDGKVAKVLVLDTILVHVAPHQQGIDGNKGQAVDRLVIGVGGHHQAGGHQHDQREKEQPIERVGRKLRAMMPWLDPVEM